MWQDALQQAIIFAGGQVDAADNEANGVNISSRLNKMATNGFTTQ